MNKPIVTADGVSKRFLVKKSGVIRPRFLEILKTLIGIEHTPQRDESTFWALRDIGFHINRGESIGIVGLNGAGKSTLLKILLGRLMPDEGSVSIDGNAGGLIELGAGFHPEQTGRQNIELNARMLGASDKRIKEKLDQIIEFAELSEFIDMPVKTYSSGMNMRLGFSIAIHFVKDLVILDEVLAVGDFEFRQKCYRKIHSLKESRSFVLVSHNTRDIALFCNKALLLHRGQVAAYGGVEDVLKAYSKAKREYSFADLQKQISKKDTSKEKKSITEIGENILKARVFNETEDYRIGKFGRIYHDAKVADNLEVFCNHKVIDGELFINNEEELRLTIKFDLKNDVPQLRIGVPFFDENGEMILGPDSRTKTLYNKAYGKIGRKSISLNFPKLPVNEGRFFICVALNNDPGFLMREHLVWLNVRNVSGEFGKIKCQFSWD